MSSLPLEDICVLDLTRLLPGPMCSLHLADMGAEVIKIEDTGLGDYARWMGPMKGEDASFFRALNRNKRGLTLDLKQAAGVELFLDLARGADVVIESFRPGVVDRLGIGYQAVRAVNPGIVYCAISGYGQSGPWRERAGHDINYCATAGILEQSGARDGPPAAGNFQIADLAGGALSAAMAISAALVGAARRGEGRYLDVAMTDCAMAHNLLPLIAQDALGESRPRGGDFLSGELPCYAVYETADGRYMALGALEDKFWRRFCERLGRPDLALLYAVDGDEREAVRHELEVIFRSRSQAEWVEYFADTDCCLSPVLSMREAIACEQIVARGLYRPQQDAEAGEVAQFAFPVQMSGAEFAVRRPAPARGEHSRELLAELGYEAARIEQLAADGVI